MSVRNGEIAETEVEAIMDQAKSDHKIGGADKEELTRGCIQ